jgi:hypothetical protein
MDFGNPDVARWILFLSSVQTEQRKWSKVTIKNRAFDTGATEVEEGK